MKEMTIRERMLKVYNNQLPDQIPIGIYSRYLPRGTWEREQRNSGLGMIFYHPICTLMSPPWHLNSGFLSEVKGIDFNISYKWIEGAKVEVREYKTNVGTVTAQITKDPVYGSDWISKHYITTEEDYRIIQYIVEKTVFSSNEKQLIKIKNDLGNDGVLLGRIDRTPFQKIVIELAGPERFLIDISTGLKAAEDLLEIMGQKQIESLNMIDETSADVIWQPENVTADITTPVFFEKYCMPYYKIIGEKCSENKKPYLVHLDGRLKSLAEKIGKSPFNCIESFSYSQMGGDISFNDLRTYCPNKVILPNFPSSLSSENENAIFSFLDKMMSEAGKEKAFMLQISEDIPDEDLNKVVRLLCQYMLHNGKLI